MSQLEVDVRFLKTDTLQQLKQVTSTVNGFNLEGSALNYPSVKQHLTALNNHSQRHQESLSQLNGTLNNLTKNIAALTQEVGELGARVSSLKQSYLTKHSVDLTETDSKKRTKVNKNTEE